MFIQKVFNEAKNALTIINNLEQDINNYNTNNCATIKIGSNTSFTKLCLMKYINEFSLIYPNVRFELNTDTTSNNLKLLQNGLLDMVIAKEPINLDLDFNYNKIGDTKYIFIANKNLYTKLHQKISLKEILNYPLLMPKSPSNSFDSINQLFKKYNLKIDSKINIGSSSLLIDFVKLGNGVGYTTQLYANDALKNKEIYIIKIAPETPNISYGIITLKNNILSYMSSKFMKYIIERKDD